MSRIECYFVIPKVVLVRGVPPVYLAHVLLPSSSYHSGISTSDGLVPQDNGPQSGPTHHIDGGGRDGIRDARFYRRLSSWILAAT